MQNRHSDATPIDPPSLSGPTQRLLERHPAQPGSESANESCATPPPPVSKYLARHGWIETWAAQWYIPM